VIVFDFTAEKFYSVGFFAPGAN